MSRTFRVLIMAVWIVWLITGGLPVQAAPSVTIYPLGEETAIEGELLEETELTVTFKKSSDGHSMTMNKHEIYAIDNRIITTDAVPRRWCKIRGSVLTPTSRTPVENVRVCWGGLDTRFYELTNPTYPRAVYTNVDGEFVIPPKGFTYSGTTLVYPQKEGYYLEHVTRITVAGGEEKHVTLNLVPLSEIAEHRLQLKGRLEKVIRAKGSRSEYSYFVMSGEEDTEHILFNASGASVGFDEFEGKRVRIQGYRRVGIIGWMQYIEDGVYVENIIIIEEEL